MQTAVITFPASNCDRDMREALRLLTGKPPLSIWHQDTTIPNVDLIALPGGFSFGDYLRCGAMAAHSPIMQEVKRHAARGVRILGVCNGFQILCEAGLLPGVLLRNRALKFICKTVHIKANDNPLATRKDVLAVPIAHHDGNYYADSDTLKQLQDRNQIAYTYCTAEGDPDNPNGAALDIAGITNAQHTILGMMPHPERVTDPRLGVGLDGQRILKAILNQ